MEVGHHKHGVVILHVRRHHRQHDAGQAAEGEHEQNADREQHGGLEGHGPFPHGRHVVEDHQPHRDGDDDGADHEVAHGAQGHADGVLVMGPNHHADAHDRDHGAHQGRVSE